MIVNAKDLSIQTSGVPNMADALSNWFSQLKIGKVVKTVVDFQLSESVSYYDVLAVLQPFTTRQLQVKPEGQRAWQWFTLHIKSPDLEFCLDEIALIKNRKYRIMQKFEWEDYGYIEYQLVEDYGQIQSVAISEGVSISEITGGEIAP